MDRQRERAPRRRRVDLEERLAANTSRRGPSGPAAGGLDEPDGAGSDLGRRAKVRESNRLEDDLARSQSGPRHADVAAPQMAAADDSPVFDLDPGTQFICEAEA